VCVCGGTEATGHALQTALASDPKLQLVRIDYQNAFNTMSCSAVLQTVARRAPEILAYVHWAYGRPSRLWVLGSEDGAAPILSSTGEQQGDPMGPLLFALPLLTPLEEAIAAVLDAHLVAVHDDVTLVGRPNRVQARYRVLETCTNPLGLHLWPSKCAVYSPTATDAAALAQKLRLPHETEGIVVAGSPIGSPSSCKPLAARQPKQ
jgi:hypothetical protein